MKILHVCLAAFYIDNYSYQENMLPKYHKLMGYDVAVIASLMSFDEDGNFYYQDTAREYICSDGYRVTRLNNRKPFTFLNKILRRYKNTYHAIDREEPEILFIHGCQFWDIRQVVKYLRKRKHIRVFVDNHADRINSVSNWFSWNILHKIIWKYCAKLIEPFTEVFYGVTPLRCDFLGEAYKISSKKIKLLELGVDDYGIDFEQRVQIGDRIRKKHNISQDDFLIVTGGKIDKRKNTHLLLRAINELSDKRIKLILFGTLNDEMKPIIDELSKTVGIRNIGWINADQVNDILLASELVVFPGTHSVLWEQAVGLGIPCVFKYWRGLDHVDLGGNCRFLYMDEVEEIKSVLEGIIGDKSVYHKMKNIAEGIGMKRFSYSDIAKRAIQIEK
ncbi:MAG: glycosyltransferase family 4 protein [Bacteroidales bacterium]|nr:glycosyltransferase family 4 protein [Bacteroidales bacterium]